MSPKDRAGPPRVDDDTQPFILEPVGAPRDAEKADSIEDTKREKAHHDFGKYRIAVLPVQAYEVDGEICKDRGEAERVAVERAFLEWYENGADTVLAKLLKTMV